MDVLFLLVSHTHATAWCKACRAVERPFRKLAQEFPTVKFVEVPVTKDNAYLHKGLGIPSLPFGHIYHHNPDEMSAGTTLVEEMKINKHVFADFKQTLKTYVDGQCPMVYEDETEDTTTSNPTSKAATIDDNDIEGAWN